MLLGWWFVGSLIVGCLSEREFYLSSNDIRVSFDGNGTPYAALVSYWKWYSDVGGNPVGTSLLRAIYVSEDDIRFYYDPTIRFRTVGQPGFPRTKWFITREEHTKLAVTTIPPQGNLQI